MFKLQFKTDNASFQDVPWMEAERILRGIADKMCSGRTGGACIDINGNVIGEWELTTEGEV